MGIALVAVVMNVGCSTVVLARGSGSEIAARVNKALLEGDWIEASPCKPVDENEGMVHAKRRWDPAAGQLAFTVHPYGWLARSRVIEVAIIPWDERPDVQRKIWIEVWLWNWLPPWWKGPDTEIQAQATKRIQLEFAPNE